MLIRAATEADAAAVAECGILVLWLITGQRWLPVAGAIDLQLGCLLLAVGMGALLFTRLEARDRRVPRRFVLQRVLPVAGLLLSNLPVAYGVSVLAIAVRPPPWV